MLRIMVCAFITLLALIAGCVPIISLQPLFQTKECIVDPRIAGTWIGKDIRLVIQTTEDSKYTITFSDSATRETWDGRLGKLGNHLFFDLSPQKPKGMGLIAGHMIFKVERNADSLAFTYLDDDWVKHSLKSRKIGIAHMVVNDDIVLTASTRELQKLVAKYSDDKEAFPDRTVFRAE